MVYTILQFESKLVEQFNIKGVNKFKIFDCCVTDKNKIYWTNLLENEFPVTDRINGDMDRVIVFYIEEVASMRNLEESILQFLS